MIFFFLGIVIPGLIAVIVALTILSKPRKRMGEDHGVDVSHHAH